jgi:TonB-linked SusC/RagA family outer membrane protein
MKTPVQKKFELTGSIIYRLGLVFLFLFALNSNMYAQSTTITGTVTDASSNEALPGVTIVVLGTTNGTVTDISGNYSLQVDAGDVLRYTSVGYVSEEITVGNQSVIDVLLVADVTSLQEIVVIGYGSVKRSDLTGSVGSISSDELVSRGTTGVLDGMQGIVPGVDISQTSVKPGGGFDITIRGQNSLQGGTPLYVVDGMVADDIDFLNPADIKSIDILKDASSTAIYGSRGSNGVVIVETKTAQNNAGSDLKVSYDGFYGVKQLARMPDFQTAREFAEYRYMCYREWDESIDFWTQNTRSPLGAASPVIIGRLYNEEYTDWMDLITESGHQQNHYVNMSGSSNKLTYNVGLGYQNEKANFKGQYMDRFNIKLSVNHRASDFFQMGATANISQTLIDNGQSDGYEEVNKMAPFWNAFWPDGSIIVRPGADPALESTSGITGTRSPLAELASGKEETRRHDILALAYMELTPVKGLSLRSTLSTRFYRSRYGEFQDIMYDSWLDESYNDRIARSSNTEVFDFTWDNIINYKTQFGENHNLSVDGIFSTYKTRDERLAVRARNMPYPSEWYNLFSGEFDASGSSSSYREASLVSYLARVNYDFKGKYLLTGSLRYDGSSKLADKWALFPSFAAAWRVSEESFMQADWLSDLKLRFSYGNSGNNNGVGPYATKAGPDTGNTILYNFGGTTVSGFGPGAPVNENLAWEKTRELNLAVDFGLFEGRVSGSVDIYDKLSDGLLMSRRLAIESGVGSMDDNIGSVSNKGVEVSLNTVNVSTKNFTWTTGFTFARNKNAIESLYGKKEDVIGEKRFIGQPINVEFDYLTNGVWSMAEYLSDATVFNNYTFRPGSAKTVDTNGDGSITSDDKVILGSNNPDWTGAFMSKMRFKNWDFSFNVITRQGVVAYDEFMEEYLHQRSRSIVKLDFDYYIPANAPVIDWDNFVLDADGNPLDVGLKQTTEEHLGEYPLYRNNNNDYQGEGYKITDQSFVKVKNIVLGYTINNGIPKVGVDHLRVYANVLNPFVFTDYEGYDPEYAGTSLENGNGPAVITYQLGVNLSF